MKIGQWLLLAVSAALVLVSCQKSGGSGTELLANPLRISVENYAGGAPMILGNNITNPHGEPLVINKFKYYLSNFVLHKRGSQVPLKGYYFLVDESDEPSQHMDLNAPSGEYDGISFLIGVDSTRNVSGVQEGALDPANGMFWTWNSGYIMAKLEGKSVVSTAPFQNVTYHIGGFRTGESTVKTIDLSFSQEIRLSPHSNVELVLRADADKWFKSVHDITIAAMPRMETPGPAAVLIAENYATMFNLQHIRSY